MKKKPTCTTVLEIAETTFVELFSDTASGPGRGCLGAPLRVGPAGAAGSAPGPA